MLYVNGFYWIWPTNQPNTKSPTTDRMKTYHLPTDPPAQRPNKHRPTDKILFQRLENWKIFANNGDKNIINTILVKNKYSLEAIFIFTIIMEILYLYSIVL